MKQILNWAVIGAFSLGGLDLLLGYAAMLGLIDSGYYQIANLPAIMIYDGGASSVENSLLIWVPQMTAIGFIVGGASCSLVALTKRFSGRSKTRATER
jgi:hypothetical protein